MHPTSFLLLLGALAPVTLAVPTSQHSASLDKSFKFRREVKKRSLGAGSAEAFISKVHNAPLYYRHGRESAAPTLELDTTPVTTSAGQSAITVGLSTNNVVSHIATMNMKAVKAVQSAFAVGSPQAITGPSTATSTVSAQVAETTGDVEAEAGMSPDGDTVQFFTCEVEIGGQPVSMMLDTGSADIWVFGPGVLPAGSKTPTYNPSGSTTWSQNTSLNLNINYLDGSGISGMVGTDTVTIAGVPIEHQTISVADSKSGNIDGSYSGIVGMGFIGGSSVTDSSGKPAQQKSYLDNLVTGVFTADLEIDGSGEYEIGVIDSAKYTGGVSYTPVDMSQGYWQIETSQFKIGNVSLSREKTSGIVDTGTSLAMISNSTLVWYYRNIGGFTTSINGNPYWVYPQNANPPPFSILVGDSHWATITSEQINQGPITVGAQQFNVGVLQASSDDLEIYGIPFLGENFVVFDKIDETSARLGMADKS